MHQLALILAAKGTPTPDQMASINPLWKEEIEEHAPLPDFLRQVLVDDTPSEVIDLIERLLEYEPQKRITASQAL